MIRRAGVIYQDMHSLGFLRGLKKRLDCQADLISAPTGAGRSRNMTRKQARIAWKYFQGKSVDVVVRLTDADRARWQDVKREEQAVFPHAAQNAIVCGIAVNNTEEWLALDPDYLAKQLDLDANEIRSRTDRANVIKGAIARKTEPGERASDLVERLVADAPRNVFRRWLKDESFRDFYTDCRRIANQYDCTTRNEL